MQLEQYKINGAKTYVSKCQNCHGENGEGLQNLYPSIKDGKFLENKEKLICIILNGSPQTSTLKMPKISGLYNIDLAELSTFLHYKFKQKDTLITVSDIEAIKCK